MMKLYGYFRSSAAYRVRIALQMKGLTVEAVPVNLREGSQRGADFLDRNPAGLVPLLEDGPHRISQSLAIIEYLDEIHPTPALLPRDPADRACVRAIALSVACDIHPLNNLRVLNYLSEAIRPGAEIRDQWYAHWIHVGFAALEAQLAREPRVGTFCAGDAPGLAEIFLVPQVYNAERMNLDLAAYPTIRRIVGAARALPAFEAAAPAHQPDAP